MHASPDGSGCRRKPRAARWLGLMLAGATLLPLCSAAAEEAPEEEIVVTATRRHQPKQTASAPVTVITRAEIAASGAPTVAEALRGVLGLDIPRQGPLGAASTPSLRGSSAGQVLVMVDGRRLNNPQNGEADLSDIAVENIERIEVVRGGVSALYGSDAVGGVINIITRSPSGASDVRLSQSYGSFNTRMLTGLYGGSTGRLRYNVTAQHTASTNDFEYLDPGTGAYAKRRNAGYTGWDAGAKLVADLGTRRRLTFSAEISDAEKKIPGTVSWATPSARQSDHRTLLDLLYEAPVGEAADLSTRLYRVEQNNRYQDPDSFPAPTDASHYTTADVVEMLGHARLPSEHILTYGAEYRSQKLKSNQVGRRSRGVGAVYVQDQWALGALQAIPGVRVDFVEGFYGEVSPKLGVVYQASDGLTLRGNVGRSFRTPTLNDLYWPTDAFATGNPGLQSEHALMADAGATWQATPSLEVEATAFTHRVTNLIAWQPDVIEAGKWSPTNVGKARISGVEAGVLWRASGRLDFKANVTYQDARDRGGAPGTHGKRLLMKPEVLANASATYRAGALTAGLDLRYTGRRPADAANNGFVNAALVTDLRLEAPVGRTATAALLVGNLFDERYEMQPGYPLPGRAITLRLSEKW